MTKKKSFRQHFVINLYKRMLQKYNMLIIISIRIFHWKIHKNNNNSYKYSKFKRNKQSRIKISQTEINKLKKSAIQNTTTASLCYVKKSQHLRST